MNPYGMVGQQGLFGSLRGLTRGFTLGGFLDGAQKTLGVINQAIPIVHQVGPMITNARTMFRIADVINTPDNSSRNSYTTNTRNNTYNSYNSSQDTTNRPIFYI